MVQCEGDFAQFSKSPKYNVYPVCFRDQQILCDKKPAFKKIFSCNNKEIVITSNGLDVNAKSSWQVDIFGNSLFGDE